MKILHVFKTFYPNSFGGVEQVIEILSEYVHELGGEVELLVCGPANTTYSRKSIKVHSVKANFTLSNNPISLKFIKKFIQLQKQCDVIHFHYPYLMNEILFYVKLLNKPYVVTYHSDVVRSSFISNIYKLVSSKFLKGASSVVFTSPNYMKISYTNNMNINRRFIPLTLSQDEISISGLPVRNAIGSLPKDFILFLGALRRYKGLSTLIASAKISTRTFVIAGDGEEFANLVNEVRIAGLKNVIFLGKVNELEKNVLLEKCKFLILPSDRPSEAFGVVLLEAFAKGKCVITADLPTGVTFVNEHGKTGRVFKIGDPVDLSKQIEVLFMDHEEYYNYCQNVRTHLNNKFSKSEMREYKNIYDS